MKYKLIAWLMLVTTLMGCNPSSEPTSSNPNEITFVTSSMYPPFEYKEHGKLVGFDIELAGLIAKELGKEAKFIDTEFSTVLPMLQKKDADAAIATITITQARKVNFDFTDPYYFENMSIVYKSNQQAPTVDNIQGKKIACQLGSTMEFWLKKKGQAATIVIMDNNNQAIEALKAGHVDAVLMDGAQGVIFSKKNPGLAYAIFTQSEDGYGIALKKDSPLLEPINVILKKLQINGELAKLKAKWLDDIAS